VADIITNNEPNFTTKMFKQLSEHLDNSSDHRMLRCDNGEAEILVTEDYVYMANKENYVYVGPRGITLDSANLHLAPAPDKIRVNGFWVLNEELLTTIPSTLYTPISVLKYEESPAVKEIQDLVAMLQSFV
jgi:hypothetical protein